MWSPIIYGMSHHFAGLASGGGVSIIIVTSIIIVVSVIINEMNQLAKWSNLTDSTVLLIVGCVVVVSIHNYMVLCLGLFISNFEHIFLHYRK